MKKMKKLGISKSQMKIPRALNQMNSLKIFNYIFIFQKRHGKIS